ncbi:MAG: hypothetical protein HY591_06695 [Candidatus Omnitrophica bacterium]|nr:hypothetical protein [Candidatus Omnitrophota bacterium]
MKRTLSLLTILAVLVVFTTPAFAYPKPVEKLKKGTMAVITSPLEIKDHAMSETKDAKFLPFALAGGLLKGTFYMAKKMVHGGLDIVTFPIDR